MSIKYSYKLISLILFSVLFSLSATGLEKADTAVLQALKKEEPELFERVNLIEERNRALLEVTLSDILKMVIKRSISIEANRLGEKASLEGIASSYATFQPYLTTSITGAKTAALAANNIANDTSGTSGTTYKTSTSTDTTALSTTYSKTNTLGISFSSTLSSTTNKTSTYTVADKGDTPEKISTTGPYDTTSLSATVSIPLFQDWGDINLVNVKRSELAFDTSKVTTNTTTLTLLKSVANTYWNMVGVQENIRTLQDAVALSKQLVEETKARVDVGVLNPTDLKEAQTQLASNQKDLLDKEISEQEIEDQIRVALNLGLIPYGFKPADIPKIHGEDFDFQTLLKKAYTASNTLKNLEISLKSNQYDLDEAYNSDKTNLDLSVTYTLTGWGSSASDSVQEFQTNENQGYSVGLTWKLPLFDKITPKTIIKRKIERSQLDLQIENTKSEIYVELQTLLRNLKFGIREKATAQLSVNLAKDLLDKEVEKLKIGKSTSYNVSQAQQSYTSAKLSETLVRVSNEQTFISLLILTGDIFKYYSLPEKI